MKMTRTGLCLFGVVALAPAFAPAARLKDLTPQAQAFIGKTTMVVVELKDGRKAEGILVTQNVESVEIKSDRGGGISASKVVPRNLIAKMEAGDVARDFAARLLELKLDPQSSLSIAEYRRCVALFDEFLRTCPEAAQAGKVKTLADAFRDELARTVSGEEKVAGEWLTPVKAALKKFELMTAEIKKRRADRDLNKDPALQTQLDELIAMRREVARTLPGIMQERLPQMLAKKDFTAAAGEVLAFLQFWLRHVVGSEGEMAIVVKGMDFDYILRMQRAVLEAWQAAAKPPKPPRLSPADADMVYVPGGFFLMGNRDALPTDTAFPLHIVFVSPFLIDRCEVSNAKYRLFVDHVKRSGDSAMEHPLAPPLKKHDADGWAQSALAGDTQPVVGVDWFDAYAYAKWAGKRLPTEAEWEFAAGGSLGRTFPWGEKIDKSVVNWTSGRRFLAQEMDRQNPPVAPEPKQKFGCSCVRESKQPPPPPTRLPDVTWPVDQTLPPQALEAVNLTYLKWEETYASPCGAMHMAGNASEWVQDWYSPLGYSTSALINPQGPAEGDVHIYRGGSYLSTRGEELAVYARGIEVQETKASMRAARKKYAAPSTGFRCARTLDIVAAPAAH